MTDSPNPKLVEFISRYLKTAPRITGTEIVWPAIPTPTEAREWSPDDVKKFLALVDNT